MRKLLFLAALAWCGAAPAAVTVQAPAPDFTLRNTDGRNLRLKEQRGQVVLVNFWASWCGPCKQEMPHFNRLHDKYRSAGFVLLGVNIDEDAKLGAATAGRWGLKFPVLLLSLIHILDLGGQYYNDPFDANGGVRSVTALSEASFLTQVQPVLQAQCAACHQAGSGNPGNRFVLTGSASGDYNVTLSLINDTCNAAANPLLARPATVPHPAGATTQTTALLPAGSAGYNQIAAWISLGCSNP